MRRTSSGLSSRTAPKGTGQLQKCLKNATSLIRQSAYIATHTKGKYAIESGDLTRRLLNRNNLELRPQPSR